MARAVWWGRSVSASWHVVLLLPSLLLAACTSDSGSSSQVAATQQDNSLRPLTENEQALVLALAVAPETASPATPEEPAQLTLARVRAAAAGGLTEEEAAWVASLTSDQSTRAGRLVAANAVAALADDAGEPSRTALRSLLASAPEPVRCLIVELLASETDAAARSILQAALNDASALVRAKAARSLVE